MVDRFERGFAEYVGVPHAVAMSSGTAALHVALRLVNTQPGDIVIAPTLTFIGGVAPIIYEKAVPFFVDCDPTSLGMSPAGLEEACADIRRAGKRVAAIMPTDLYGQSCDIDALGEIAERNEIPLVLDSAEGVGALNNGKHVWRGGVCAAFSFNGNKIITTSGGGMLTTADASLAERARYLVTAARQPAPHYEHTEVGYNYRLSSLSAAVGVAQLETIEQKVARRRAIFERYRHALSDIEGVSFTLEAPGRRHTRWLTVMLLRAPLPTGAAERVRLSLEQQNIEARPVWKPMHLQPAFADCKRIGGQTAEELFANGLCLPSGSALGDADIDRVIETIRAALR